MASTSEQPELEDTIEQPELEDAFEQPEPSSRPRQNGNFLMEIPKLLQEWCLSILNILVQICLIPFCRFVRAIGLSLQTLPEADRQNIFDQFPPFSESASTEPWQIFINHRGSDTKYTFAKKIEENLDSKGFRAFLDVGAIRPGDVIQREIQAAMNSASLHIAIFSPNYAQSSWCLDELAYMLKIRTPAKIIPIFYHVDPSDLRYIDQGKGIYADAFSQHAKKGRYTKERLDQWKAAIHEISFHSGLQVNNNEDEAEVLKNIVNRALEFMKTDPIHVAEYPLGLDELVQGFVESVTSEEDNAKLTGIVGIGGIGKTTLAKELFNRNFRSFQKYSFVPDVRDAASRNALLEKQKKLLRDLGVEHVSFDGVDEGKAVLANRLSSVRALIVLDDVDHIDQLYALLPNKHNLGSQSMVIVTSREWDVLESWGISNFYEMPRLESSVAKNLFCRHAFQKSSPPTRFDTLVDEFVQVCNGLPLSLKVLGAQLHRKDSIAYWKSQLVKISRILPSDIKKRLQVSYDALDKEDREMFLDAACFLIGECKSTAIALWDGSGWSGLHGLQTLVNKCLVELVSEENRNINNIFIEKNIRMHDHLRDMGREMASEHSSYRLWRPEQIDNILHFQKEIQIRGIQPPATFVAFKEYAHQLMRTSRKLNILHVQSNEFTEEFAYLSEHLVWLRWHIRSLRNLPSWLPLRHLSVLELDDANDLEELWQVNVDPPLQLRKLIVRLSFKLQRLPTSIGRLQNLKMLSLCFSGSSLPEEFCGLHSLKYLDLFCPQLSSLPAGFGNLKDLKYLMLYCRQLSTLPDSFQQLIKMKHLVLSSCETLSSLSNGFENLVRLKYLRLAFCKQSTHLEDLDISISSTTNGLSSLPIDFGNLTCSKSIILFQCSQLSTLPDSFGQLIHLEYLSLSNCEMLSSLPDCFGNLNRLKRIILNWCSQLSTLPDSFEQLIHLGYLDLTGCKMLSSLPDGFGNLNRLKHIKLQWCKRLRTLPDSFKGLIQLEHLYLDGCAKLKLKLDVFEGIRTLKYLGFSGCEELEDLPNQIKNQASLTKLNLAGCIKLRSSPSNIGQLVNLCSLKIESRVMKGLQTSLVSFPSLKKIEIVSSEGTMEFGAEEEDCKPVSVLSISSDCWPNLQNLEVENYSIVKLVNFPKNHHLIEIERLPVTLQTLSISDCEVLKNISCLSRLVRLEALLIQCCPQLEELSSFADLASLEYFRLTECPKVKKIEGLQHCKSLKHLLLRQTRWKESVIQSLEKVEGLEAVEFVCDTISALKPCIQSINIKGRPGEMLIQGSVSCVVEPILNSSEFPDLTVRKAKPLDDVRETNYFCYREGKELYGEERKVVQIYLH